MAEETAHCIACSTTNPQSLGMRFEMQGDRCLGHYTPTEEHCGWRGVTHGGLLFTALDESDGELALAPGHGGLYGAFRGALPRPVATGTALRLEAWCLKQRKRVVDLQGQIVDQESGEVVAEAEARFMLLEEPPTLGE